MGTRKPRRANNPVQPDSSCKVQAGEYVSTGVGGESLDIPLPISTVYWFLSSNYTQGYRHGSIFEQLTSYLEDAVGGRLDITLTACHISEIYPPFIQISA